MLTKYEFDKIIEALWHAKRNADPSNKAAWQMIADRAEQELSLLMSSTSVCRHEDKPCCGCDKEEYVVEQDNYDPEQHFARMEQMANEREACSICATYFEDYDNEDDVVQGFHLDCAVSQQ